MAMLNFSHEERELLREINAVLDIPRNTPEHVVRKLHANTKALVAKLRGLAPVLEARGARPKRLTKAEVRAAFAVAPELPLEEIARFKRLGYSEDVVLALRGAAIGKQIRYQQGQSDDPTASLRDDDDDFDPADAKDKEAHERAVTFHRNCASQAKTMSRCAAHHSAADLHSSAAAGGDGDAARSASKRLKG
jgi:hypothetical protein